MFDGAGSTNAAPSWLTAEGLIRNVNIYFKPQKNGYFPLLTVGVLAAAGVGLIADCIFRERTSERYNGFILSVGTGVLLTITFWIIKLIDQKQFKEECKPMESVVNNQDVSTVLSRDKQIQLLNTQLVDLKRQYQEKLDRELAYYAQLVKMREERDGNRVRIETLNKNIILAEAAQKAMQPHSATLSSSIAQVQAFKKERDDLLVANTAIETNALPFRKIYANELEANKIPKMQLYKDIVETEAQITQASRAFEQEQEITQRRLHLQMNRLGTESAQRKAALEAESAQRKAALKAETAKKQADLQVAMARQQAALQAEMARQQAALQAEMATQEALLLVEKTKKEAELNREVSRQQRQIQVHAQIVENVSLPQKRSPPPSPEKVGALDRREGEPQVAQVEGVRRPIIASPQPAKSVQSTEIAAPPKTSLARALSFSHHSQYGEDGGGIEVDADVEPGTPLAQSRTFSQPSQASPAS